MTDEKNIVATVPAVEPIQAQNMPSLTVEAMKVTLNDYTEKRKAFRDWLKSQLTEGVHYGYTPGTKPNLDASGNMVTNRRNKDGTYSKVTTSPQEWTPKQGLYKAGAQLLCDLVMVRAAFTFDKDVSDALAKSKETTIAFRCDLINLGSPFFPHRQPGEILGEGRGAFNVGEKGMNENSAIKLAQKRALVDAVLNTLGLADLFTQDIEDDAPAPNPRADKDTAAPAAPTRNERAQTKPAASQNGRKVYDAFLEARPDATQADFMSWVNSKLAAIGRADNPPTKDSPLTADDAEKLIQIINDERGN
jgi:hypothetical protein